MTVASSRWIARALRRTTEALAQKVALPDLAAPTSWDENEWRVAEAAAAMHGIAPLLALGPRWDGNTRWNAFLTQQSLHTVRRHERIARLLDRFHRAAIEAPLPTVALKGAALHALGIYAAGERPMSDLDLLVCREDEQAASELIRSFGYEVSYATAKHVVFEPTSATAAAQIGEHADNAIKIELHTSIFEQLPLERHDISGLIEPDRAMPGVQDYRSLGHLMTHLLLHAANGLAFRGLRILHLVDIARLSVRLQPTDWQVMLTAEKAGIPWWAYPVLALCERYFPASIPKDIVERTREVCPHRLRRRSERSTISEVSLSNPRLIAFPGLEWARTSREAMRYIGCRIRPDDQTLRVREAHDKYQSLGAELPWIRYSQAQRILRWALGHRQRTETFVCVRAALESDDHVVANAASLPDASSTAA